MNYKNKSFMTKKNAFTLIELLIVIAIIGILFIVLISKVDFATDKAKATGVQTDFRSFQMAFETVAREHAGFSELVDGNYDKLEVAINKHLDAKLHIDIDAVGNISMLNGATDPWNTQYHGQYVTGDDGKDRGAIVMYSNGADMQFGSELTINNGTVSTSNFNKNGKDDFSIVSMYSLVSGNGEVKTSTVGFSNNLTTENTTVVPHQHSWMDASCTNAKKCIKCNLIEGEALGHDYINGACCRCGAADPTYLVPGLYTNNTLIETWEVLTTEYGLDLTADYTSSTYHTSDTSLEYIIKNNEKMKNATKLIVGNDINRIGAYACYKTQLSSIELPDCIADIGTYAFSESKLAQIKIPSNLTNMGIYAFASCTQLTDVVFPENCQLTTIAEYAFYKTKIQELAIPDSVTVVEANAFRQASVKSIEFGASLTKLCDYAFIECNSLQEIIIPDTVTSLGYLCFGSCSNVASVYIGAKITTLNYAFSNGTTKSLKTISLSSENKSFSLVDNVLFNKDMSALILYPCGDPRTDYVVPDTVFSIFNSYLGSAKNLMHLSIPSSVYNVGGFNLSMEAYNIFENGCYIGNDDNPYYIFAQALNDEVETITIHPDTQIIAEASLDSDSLKTVYIPESVYLIGRQAGVFKANQVFFADPNQWYLNNNATPYKGSALTSSAMSDPTTAAQMIYKYNQKYFRKVK